MKNYCMIGFIMLTSCGPPGPGARHAPSLVPPFHVPRSPKEVLFEKADFVGIVRIKQVPQSRPDGFPVDAPPEVLATPERILKGAEVDGIRIVWQTHPLSEPPDLKRDRVQPPTVGDDYIVYLAKKGNSYERFAADWSFHKLPKAPNVSVDYFSGWRVVKEVSPFLTKVGETVQYRNSGTRVDAEPFNGVTYTLAISSLTLVDFSRKKLVPPKNGPELKKLNEEVKQGHTVVDRIELNKFFNLDQPGEYWLLLPDHGVLRFEVSDKIVIR